MGAGAFSSEPVSVTLSAEARRLLLTRLHLSGDAELLHALGALGVTSLHSGREVWRQHARMEAEELLRRIALQKPLPQMVCGCPSWSEHLSAHKPEWAELVCRAPFALVDDAGKRQALVTGCATRGAWLKTRTGVAAYAAGELASRLIEVSEAPKVTASLRPARRGERLRDVMAHAVRLQTGASPKAGFLPLRAASSPFVLEGELSLGGREIRVAAISGVENAMRYLCGVMDGQRVCHLMEVSACATCRA